MGSKSLDGGRVKTNENTCQKGHTHQRALNKNDRAQGYAKQLGKDPKWKSSDKNTFYIQNGRISKVNVKGQRKLAEFTDRQSDRPYKILSSKPRSKK